MKLLHPLWLLPLLLSPANADEPTLATRQLEAVGAAISVPETWHFHEDVEDGVTVYQFTREQTDATGAAFLVGITLSVTPDVPGRAGATPSQYAADLLGFAVEDGGGAVRTTDAPPFKYLRAEYGVDGDAGPVRIVDLAAANDSTGTLYFLAWQCPASEESALAPLREKILASLVLDPKK